MNRKYNLKQFNPASFPEWEQKDFWENHYQEAIKELRNESKSDQWGVFKEYHDLYEFLDEHPDWEVNSILDAGCGLALAPYVLKHWGYQVTALDISQNAIEFIETFNPTEDQLASCLNYYRPNLPLLRTKQKDGGSLHFVADDWNNLILHGKTYDLIHCMNGLNKASLSVMLNAIRTFKQVLNPGGVLIMRNSWVFMKEFKDQEPIYVGGRIDYILEKAGFTVLYPDSKKDTAYKFVRHSYSRGYYPTDEELAERKRTLRPNRDGRGL